MSRYNAIYVGVFSTLLRSSLDVLRGPWREPLRLRQGSVEGDWSGAAVLLVPSSAGSITVTGLDRSSTQADRAVWQALEYDLFNLSIQKRRARHNTPVPLGMGAKSLQTLPFQPTDCPDFSPLVC